jgi:hypothetical protein
VCQLAATLPSDIRIFHEVHQHLPRKHITLLQFIVLALSLAQYGDVLQLATTEFGRVEALLSLLHSKLDLDLVRRRASCHSAHPLPSLSCRALTQ